MQTYGNFTSGYRPHLDSGDFLRTLRTGVLIALLLSVAFSVRGNYLGLEQTLEKNWLWLTCIAAGITLTSAFLAMLVVMDVPGLARGGRILVAFSAIGLFYISTRLTLIGFGAGDQQRQENLVQEHPDVGRARKDLEEIVKRQRQYGVTEAEKASLLKREKEQRAWLRETETRVRMGLGDDAESRAAKAMGDEAEIARQIFAVAPDLSIMVLSPILVLLYGAAGNSQSRGSQPEKQIVYVPVQQLDGQRQFSLERQPEVAQPAAPGESRTNGKFEQPVREAWNPFLEGRNQKVKEP